MSANSDPGANSDISGPQSTRSLEDAVAGAPWRQTQLWNVGQPLLARSALAHPPKDIIYKFGGMATHRTDTEDTLPLSPPAEDLHTGHLNKGDIPEVSEFKGQYVASLGITVNRTVEIMVDINYPTTPLDLYNYMYDSNFFTQFLTENQGVWDLGFEEWQARDGDPSLLMRDFHYTKPMSGAGPKEVYCQEHEENQHRDENDYIETETTTHTPDVTFGSSFYVVTHTKINWAEDRNEGCVLNIVLEIVWTGWCPFKGMIEGRIIDGQKQYSADLDAAVREELASAKTAVASGRSPHRREGRTRLNLEAINLSRSLYANTNMEIDTGDEKKGSRPVERLPSRLVRFDEYEFMSSSSDEEKHAMSEIGAELQMEQQQLYSMRRRHRLRLAVLLVLFSVALTLIVFRLFQYARAPFSS